MSSRPFQGLKVAVVLYYIDLVQYAMTIVPDIDIASEVVSKLYVKIFKSEKELYDPSRGATTKTFLFTCVGNACLSYLRWSKDPLKEGKWELDELVADDTLPVDEKVYSIQFIQLVYQFMNGQEPKYKDLFQQLYMEGLELAEAAIALGIPKSTAYRHKAELDALLKKQFRGWDPPAMLVVLPLLYEGLKILVEK
jgi:RNA polymerase sigma factor (sigma-70 family)